MAEAEAIPRPHFAVIDPHEPLKPSADDVPTELLADWARRIEDGVGRDPIRYRRALGAIGAFDGTILPKDARLLLNLSLDEEELGAAVNILTYLTLHADRGVEYDPATEAAMIEDAGYRSALAKQRKAVSYTVSTGKMSHEQRVSSQAEPARDAARKYSLLFFIDRMIDWDRQQQQQSQSPEQQTI